MSYSEEKYLNMATQSYPQSKNSPYGYDKILGDLPVTVSTAGTCYENNGLQAAIVNDHGQITAVFRGTDTNMDWLRDTELNNPSGYMDKNTQFRDADNWLKSQQQAGGALYGVDMSKVTFTGHSLGGALAQYEAVKNNASAVSFSGPSPWNMLTPTERIRALTAHVKNLCRMDDAIPTLPPGVPRIGKQVFVAGRTDKVFVLFGAGGHDYSNHAYATKDGQLVRDNQVLGKTVNEVYSHIGVPWAIKQLGGILAPVQGITSALKTGLQDEIEKIMGAAQTASAYGTILADNLKSQDASVLFLEAVTPLEKIKQANDKLVSHMKEAYQNNLTTTANMWSWLLDTTDIQKVMEKEELQVRYHIDKDKVSDISKKISDEIGEIKKFATVVNEAVGGFGDADKAWAETFGK